MEKNKNTVDFDDFVSNNNIEISQKPKKNPNRKWVLLSCASVLLFSSIFSYLGYKSKQMELDNKALNSLVQSQMKSLEQRSIVTTLPYAVKDTKKLELYQLKIIYQANDNPLNSMNEAKPIRTEFSKDNQGKDIYTVYIPNNSLPSDEIFNRINNSNLHKNIHKNDVTKNIDFFNDIFKVR